MAARKLNPVETLHGELQTIRKRVADIKQQIAAVESAPATKAEQAAALSGWIDTQAGAYADRVRTQLATAGREPLDPDLVPIPHIDGSASYQTEAIIGLLCLACGDAMKQRLATLLPEGGYSAEDRAEQLAGLDEQRLALEIQEEELITQAEGFGIELLRRTDADPRAILTVPEVA